MLFIDTMDVGTEGSHAYKTIIPAKAIMQCFNLNIPCFVRIESVGDLGAEEVSLLRIDSIIYGEDETYIFLPAGGLNALYVAAISDPEDMAIFMED